MSCDYSGVVKEAYVRETGASEMVNIFQCNADGLYDSGIETGKSHGKTVCGNELSGRKVLRKIKAQKTSLRIRKIKNKNEFIFSNGYRFSLDF